MDYVILYVISSEMAQNTYQTFGKTVKQGTHFQKKIFFVFRDFLSAIFTIKSSKNVYLQYP